MKNIFFSANLYKSAVAVAVIAVAVFSLTFLALEPALGLAVVDDFTIRQQITDEISFTVPAADVTMVGSIQGITGGSATGTTYTVVRSNAAAGYTLDMKFSNSPAMRGDVSLSASIRDYGVYGAEPTFGLTASTAAQFAYTISASTTTDIDPSFLDNGGSCNSGSGYTADKCWKGASTSDFRIVNRSTNASGGATTSIKFVIVVPNNPNPSLVQDYYTATATLTALNK